MKYQTIRDVYNLACGGLSSHNLVLIDIRSENQFVESHIASSRNFDIQAAYSIFCCRKKSYEGLFESITSIQNIPKAYYCFIADDDCIDFFQIIYNAFKCHKYNDLCFMESVFPVFAKQYPFLCNYNPAKLKFPCEILPNLLLGPCPPETSSISDYLQQLKITHVLNVSKISYDVPQNISCLKLDIFDSRREKLPIDEAVRFIDNALSSPSSSSRVLVHCRLGISRSSSCVIAYLLKRYRYTMDQCLQIVKAQRSGVMPNDGFLEQLRSYEKELGIKPESFMDKIQKKGGKDSPSKGGMLSLPFNIKNFTNIPFDAGL